MQRHRYVVILLLVMLSLLTLTVKSSTADNRLSGIALVDALRQGGYTIYFRHAATDWTRDDYVMAEGDWTSCDPDRMRQLTNEGRDQARRIGEAIRALDIPVGRILSSEYCRARETAKLMNLGYVSPTRSLMNTRVANLVGGDKAVILRAQQEIGRHPVEGTNTVLVAHGNLMRAATGFYTDEGGAAVFAPIGDGDFTLVALIASEEWTRLLTDTESEENKDHSPIRMLFSPLPLKKFSKGILAGKKATLID
jgi:broad specificity phosphatase PhoE